MMRPQRINEGADHELILGMLGAHIVLDELRDLLAWIAAGDMDDPANPTDLVDSLLGIAALGASLGDLPPARHDPADTDDTLDADDADLALDPHTRLPLGEGEPSFRPRKPGDLLR